MIEEILSKYKERWYSLNIKIGIYKGGGYVFEIPVSGSDDSYLVLTSKSGLKTGKRVNIYVDFEGKILTNKFIRFLMDLLKEGQIYYKTIESI